MSPTNLPMDERWTSLGRQGVELPCGLEGKYDAAPREQMCLRTVQAFRHAPRYAGLDMKGLQKRLMSMR